MVNMAGVNDKYGDDMAQVSIWDTLFCTSHVFLLGVAIGSFLTYHYFCKSSSSSFLESSNGSTPGISLTTPESSSTSNGNSWRASNVEEERLTINPEQHNRRRRSSLLYH